MAAGDVAAERVIRPDRGPCLGARCSAAG